MSNPRIFAQQGIFLCKLIDGASFAQLLMTMMMHEELTDKPVIRKREIGSSLRIKFLRNAYSKKLDNLKFACALYFAYYNFCRVHSTLRVSPAMEAGIADHIWTLEELLKSV